LVGCFGQQVYSPKQWVNFIFEGTSLSFPVAQLRADFGQLVYSVGGQLWEDLMGCFLTLVDSLFSHLHGQE
jgi:hypothetical protein